MITINEMLNDNILAGVLCGKKPNKIDTMQDIEMVLTIFFEQIATSQMKWKELPKEIPYYVVERTLFYFGSGVLFKMNDKYFFLPNAWDGMINIYGEPVGVRPIGLNGQTITPDSVIVSYQYDSDGNIINEPNGVLIRNNEQLLSTYFCLRPLISRLAFIWQGLGNNEALSRIKGIIHANKDVAGAISRQMKDLIGGKSPVAVVSDKKFGVESMDTFNLDVTYTPKEYWDDWHETMSLALTMLGINNSFQSDKAERLLVDEVNSNNEFIGCSLATRLRFREDACEKAKDVLGLNLEVTTISKEQEEIEEQKKTQLLKEFGGNLDGENKDTSSPKNNPPTNK